MSKNGPRKRWFCEGMILWWGFRGFHLTQMNSMAHGTHLGLVIHPKQHFVVFCCDFQFPGKLQVAPTTSLWPSLLPLVAVPVPSVGPGGSRSCISNYQKPTTQMLGFRQEQMAMSLLFGRHNLLLTQHHGNFPANPGRAQGPKIRKIRNGAHGPHWAQ